MIFPLISRIFSADFVQLNTEQERDSFLYYTSLVTQARYEHLHCTVI